MAFPSPTNSTQPAPSLTVLSGTMPTPRHPWRRFVAKGVDNVLVILFSLPVLMGYLFAQDIAEVLLLQGNSAPPQALQVAAFLVLSLMAIATETLLLATWGTTLGKWLLGLKVTTQTGKKLTWTQSFRRALCLNGLVALCNILPLGGIVLLIYQQKKLARSGFTSWDQREQFLVCKR